MKTTAHLLALVFAITFTWSAHAAPGDLDPSFGGTGKVTTDFGLGKDQALGVALQPDGKIVVAGNAFNGSNADFAVFRYNANGTLDTTFGGTGKVTTAIGAGNDYAASVAVQADGKIVAVGYSEFTTDRGHFALVRYDVNGNLDTSFGGTGKVVTAIDGYDDHAQSVAVQSDGKIVVAGYSANGFTPYDAVIARYNTNGALDISFNGSGVLLTDVGSAHNFNDSVAIQSDGKIVAVGQFFNGSNSDFTVIRYNANGTLDTPFGSGGIVTTAIGSGDEIARSVVVHADGKIVVAGNAHNGTNNDFALVRYNANGILDTSFNTTGKVMADFGSGDDLANSVAVQIDGKIVVAGYSSSGGNLDFALARYNANGSLDTSFTGTGKVTTPIGTGNEAGYGVAVQSDGKIVVAGDSFNGNDHDIALVRYLGDGPNLIFNGSFELPALPSASGLGLPAGSTDLSGWTIGGTGGVLFLQHWSPTAEVHAVDGVQTVNFNGGNSSPGTTISQTFNTVIGANYRANFYVGRNGGGAGSVSLTASIRSQTGSLLGQTVAVRTINGYGNAEELLFTATTTSTTLEFLDVSTATIGVDAGLDAVAVTRVPAANSNPVPGPDTMLIVTNPVRTINPLTNDTDPDGHAPLSVTGAANGAKGTVVFTGTSVTYTAATLGTGTDTFTYTVSDGFGGSATGTVKVFSIGAQAGFYSGLIDAAGSVKGASQITMSSSGALTGRIYFGGLKYSFKGLLDDNGEATIQISRSTQALVLVHLALVPGEAPTFLVEIEQQGVIAGTGEAQRSGTNTPGRRRYTLLLPPDPAQAGSAAIPQGTGYASVSFSAKGKISIAGATGDGAKFSTASALRTDNTFPFFAPIYGSPRGEIYGTLTMRDVPGVSDLDGVLTWTKPLQLRPKPTGPASFTTTTAAIGSLYVQPKPAVISEMLAYNVTGDASVAFTEGNLVSPLSALIHVGALNPPLIAPPILDLKFRITNGVFVGNFTRPGVGKTRFQGAVFQKQNRGSGYFIGTDRSGAVELTPSP